MILPPSPEISHHQPNDVTNMGFIINNKVNIGWMLVIKYTFLSLDAEALCNQELNRQ